MIDQMTIPKTSLDEFTVYSKKDLNKFCELNDNMIIEKHQVEDLEYLTIKNILKYPDELRKFCTKFPCEDRMRSIKDVNTTDIASKAPGWQQPIDAKLLGTLSKNLHNIMLDQRFCKYNYNIDLWEFYTNCCYPGMESYKKNYLPHVDTFTYAFNIFLSEPKDTGTTFFKYKTPNGKIYYESKHLLKNQEDSIKFSEMIKERSTEEAKFEKWVAYDGDEHFIKYNFVPAQYNCATIYKGQYWHSIYYHAREDDDVRYSIVGVLK